LNNDNLQQGIDMSALTLDKTNSTLQKIGADCLLTSESCSQLLKSVPASRLITAINKATTDSGARLWLYKVIAPFRSNATTSTLKATASHKQTPVKHAPALEGSLLSDYDHYAENSNKRGHQHNELAPEVIPNTIATPRTTTATPTARSSIDKKFTGHSVFGSKAALYFGYDQTRSGAHTLRIDAATAIAERKFDWNTKIGIQVTAQELPVIAALFCGLIDKCEFKNHGAKKNKGFKIESQPSLSGKGKQLFFNVSEAGKPLKAIPVGAEDTFFIRNLLLSQLAKNSPELDGTILLASLKVFAQMLH
jgi:hypothetical protein